MRNQSDDFWALTAYFNLTDSSARLANYRCFRDRLTAPLLTIEWSPEGAFQLRPGDAEILLQVGGGDLMWQKERLLKIALSALPAQAKYVAWLDGDILFQSAEWKERAREKLGGCSVVQLFDEVAYLDRQESLRVIRAQGLDLDSANRLELQRRESFFSVFERLKEDIVAYDLDRRFQPDPNKNYNIMSRPAYGFAWAARTEFLREIGLYDRCIVGGGDLLFSYAISGRSPELIENHRSAGWAFYGDCESYRRWAARAAEACRGRMGCVRGRIFHLFHGTLQQRQYKSRIDGLVPFALDLDADIAAEPGRPWHWVRDREALNRYFMKYLRGRNEDGAAAADGGTEAMSAPPRRRRTAD